MALKVLIVEDQFIEANNLEIMLEEAGYLVCGMAKSVQEAIKIIDARTPDLALVDIQLKGGLSGIDLAVILKQRNIPFIYVSANSDHATLIKAKATQPYGFIVKPFRERDLIVTLEIAQYRHENSLDAALIREDKFRKSLQDIVKMEGSVTDKMHQISKTMQAILPYDYLAICIDKGREAINLMSYLRAGFEEYQFIGLEEFQVITKTNFVELYVMQYAGEGTERSFFICDDFKNMLGKFKLRKQIADKFMVNSLLTYPLDCSGYTNIHLYFYSRRTDAYSSDQVALLDRLNASISFAICQVLGLDIQHTPYTTAHHKKLTGKNTNTAPVFEGIVGKSHLLLNVFDHITQVAPADTAVLILGESGTGKERVAHSIHASSGRKEGPFVKVNCAALPSSLIESELFGHEKGAFTGAVNKHVGKFERAHQGTIFLDEIGDMPYELQAKLLRVLQEKEIERIAGNAPIKIDVRVIAATNHNLEKEVAAGRFRLDLYYRLNVFPITLPSLRERKDDIPLLIDHFISGFNIRLGKNVTGISARGLKDAMEYNWPGNIRELENLVERAVLVSQANHIKRLAIPVSGNAETVADESSANGFKSIVQNERDHILNALKKCKGKVWGAGGAAELLNLPPSTLNSKIRKLGIRRDFT
ncbi:sigma 54-interacting transcriptional regulator [Pedobacter alluvionis]|uniref:Response regulator n=1 Tax=Pedobacter alluvionis TaxID=475253 RepID=A0A497YE21_9SPHI|nr:sigma 54-interacting transcriptional regulator [Pedobacter alluvionis]RLJ80991.1 transcriptional regulator with GAF, ATPase, and Fis domain [Pedobacter alluvionis]TFB27897.1 response regulator [Pedobacter alluvionis]